MTTTIADTVREAGIVGAGGAGFPTHVKFGSTVDTVIANGAECEPLLRCDKAVMRERAELVVAGLALLADATSAKRAVVALKGHYQDVVEQVRAAASRCGGIEVYELDNYYPAGDEQVLVNEITGRVVPEGGIPLQVDVVVNNVITLSQVALAVKHGTPVTDRVLTVGGAVVRPITVELPVGTSFAAAVGLAGGPTVERPVLIDGGPMMGPLVHDPDEPITKKTAGIIVLADDHPVVQRKSRAIGHEMAHSRAACCSCRMCTDLCPRFNLGHQLQPHLAMRALLRQGLSDPPPDHLTAAYLCCLCNVCESYACTLDLSPRAIFQELQAQLRADGVQNPHQRKECQPDDFQKDRRVPLPRLIAKLGLTDYVKAPDVVALGERNVSQVKLRLSQHTGAPAVPVVSVGQTVTRGQLVAEIPEGKLGARIHASITGRVSAVDDREIQINES